MNLIEGMDIPSKRRAHLDQCSQCYATWKSIQSAHADFARIARNDTDVVEPDWTEFRSSVRDVLLSRSAKRASVVRRWTGWPIQPVMAWALSVIMVVGVTAGAFLWNQRTNRPATPAPIAEVPADTEAFMDAEMTVWSQTSVFEELSQLRTVEEEHFRAMLLAADQGASER